jgi:hypothetical protein
VGDSRPATPDRDRPPTPGRRQTAAGWTAVLPASWKPVLRTLAHHPRPYTTRQGRRARGCRGVCAQVRERGRQKTRQGGNGPPHLQLGSRLDPVGGPADCCRAQGEPARAQLRCRDSALLRHGFQRPRQPLGCPGAAAAGWGGSVGCGAVGAARPRSKGRGGHRGGPAARRGTAAAAAATIGCASGSYREMARLMLRPAEATASC